MKWKSGSMKRPGIRFRNVDHDKVTGTKYEQIQCVVWLAKLLIRAGDVEQNPGPKAPAKEAKPDKATIMANKVDAHDAKLGELEALVKAQAELIEEMKKQQVELTAQLEEKQVDLRDRLEANKVEVQTSMGQLKVALEDELRRTGSNLDHKITDFKASSEQTARELKEEISTLRTKVDSGVDNLGSQSADTTVKVREMEIALEDIQEKLWELDKSWKNNLVFYGVKSDAGVEEHPSITEAKIREVIKHFLQISRDVPILKVRRTPNGPTVRGSKPITVCFEKWGDKDEILRKANLLRGSNIYISEDFSKKVKDQRAELQKFLKLVRRKKPSVKFSLHFDKLFLDNEIYIYNEVTGQVEQVTATLNSSSPLPGERPPSELFTPTLGHPLSAPSNPMRVRKGSSGKTRLEKSYSTESSLNHLVPTTPVYSSRTRQGYDSETEPDSQASSPVKSRKSRMNGHHSTNSPKKSKPHPSRRPAAVVPVPDEEVVTIQMEKIEHISLSAATEDDSNEINEEMIVADYKKINTLDGPIRKLEPVIPETIPE